MTNETSQTTDFDAIERLMSRQRAKRLFDDRPVDDALIERAIRAATYAPSGGNRQPWAFIVIRDANTKRQLGALFDELGRQLYGDHAPERTPWDQVPALIAVCNEENMAGEGANIYPAVQNLLLAIQGQGLGGVLTTRWKQRATEVKSLLGLPDAMDVQAIIPVGWPAKRYGRGTRKPVAEVTYRERFGQPW